MHPCPTRPTRAHTSAPRGMEPSSPVPSATYHSFTETWGLLGAWPSSLLCFPGGGGLGLSFGQRVGRGAFSLSQLGADPGPGRCGMDTSLQRWPFCSLCSGLWACRPCGCCPQESRQGTWPWHMRVYVQQCVCVCISVCLGVCISIRCVCVTVVDGYVCE